MTTTLAAEEDVGQVKILLRVVCWLFHPKESKYRTDDVLQLSHRQIGTGTTSTAIAEWNPVQMHVIGRL